MDISLILIMNQDVYKRQQLRNGTGKPYIPGSSIKGAIRTALLNIFLGKLQRNWREDELKNKRGNFSDKAVQSIIFGKDPNHDFMRFRCV